jgi:hypothetical protein
MSNRATLKGFFVTTARPKQVQFEDLIDSTVSLVEPNTGSIALSGGIIVGNTAVPATPGAIKWNGTNFEFHTVAGFQVLNLTGAVVSNPQAIGNVTIGSNLLAGGTLGVVAHATKYNTTDFGFAQNSAGVTIVNSPLTGSIQLRNSTAQIAITIQGGITTVNNSLVVGTPPAGAPAIPVTVPATTLTVFGEAQKLTGPAWAVMSDIRVKKDITGFSEGLDKLIQVKPVRFKYKGFENVEGADKEQVGVLAHEVREVFPYMVNAIKTKISPDDTEEKDLLMFNSSALQFVMINAIKELNQRLDKIEKSFDKEQN